MMVGQLGFTLPLLIILGLESILGALLMFPKPLSQPAVVLARATHTQIGSTIFYTLASLLLLLMATPVYDVVQLYKTANMVKEGADPTAVDKSEQQTTLLSFVLTGSCLAIMFFLRKLGDVMAACDRQAINQAAVLKQVEGLQSEYARMADNSAVVTEAAGGTEISSGAAAAQPSSPPAGAPGAGAMSDDEVAQLRKLLASLQEMNSTLNARLDKANKAHKQAESNLSALQTQSKGLENEYDRLLSEHDELKRVLQRAGVAIDSIGAWKKGEVGMEKKDE